MKRFLTLAACAATLFSPLAALAQRSPASFPVIVTFQKDVALESFRGVYREDERAQAQPGAWKYLEPGVAGAVQLLETEKGFRATHVYSHALRGFAARLTARQIEELENDPMVAHVEADEPMHVYAQSVPWGINRVDADLSSVVAGNGAGAISAVSVYVIDTGIAAHADLRLVGHVNFAGGANTDCHGHGTHVAGTISARDNTASVVGVAPGAPLYGVKVLGCDGSGTTSGVIKGVDWVTANARRPAVANMSLGGGLSLTLDNAVRRSVASGVFYALAAGNEGIDACLSSPARIGASTPGAMTVAATDSGNREASWSNFGSCVDVWAPGVSILSTRMGGGTATMSGTSMASPHVAGGGALALRRNTAASPATVESSLKQTAIQPGTRSKNGAAIRLENVDLY